MEELVLELLLLHRFELAGQVATARLVGGVAVAHAAVHVAAAVVVAIAVVLAGELAV